MEDKQQMDETLAAVTQFLSEYEAPAVAVADAAPIPAVDELLLASQLLVTETEASLAQASVDLHEAEAPPTDENASEDSDRSAAAQQQSKAERRRKITNAQAAKRRVKYLRRVKDKRETLKRQVRELSDELERRKVAQQRAKQEAERADALTLSVWRATCVRQKERRLESEGQQRRLKAAVISRAQLIHQMHSLLQHRMASSQLESLLSLEGPSSGWEKKGTALFKTFVHELDAIYAQTNEVIETLDVKFSCSLMYKRTWKWNQGMTFLESADATVIPFGFEQARHAVSFAMLSDPRENPHSEGSRTRRTRRLRRIASTTRGSRATASLSSSTVPSGDTSRRTAWCLCGALEVKARASSTAWPWMKLCGSSFGPQTPTRKRTPRRSWRSTRC